MTIHKLLPLFLLITCIKSYALDYKDSLLAILQTKGPQNLEKKADVYLELSKFYWTNLTDSAISMTYMAIEIGEELGDESIMASGYYNLGMIEYVNGSFSNGYASFTQASDLYFKVGDMEAYANSLYQSGVCLKKIDQLSDAAEVLERAYHEVTKTHHNQLAFTVAQELGSVYSLLGMRELAEKYSLEGLKIAKIHADTSAIIEANIALGCFYQDLFELNKSLNSFNEALKCVHAENHQLKAQLLNHIGEVYLFKNEINEALNYFNLALIAAKEGDSKLTQSRSHFNLSKIYELQGKYALALIEYKLYNQIQDSVNAVLKTQTISELQAKFDNISLSKEVQFKDLEMLKKDLETAEADARFEDESMQKRVIIFGLGIVLLLGLGLFFALRKQRKLNTQLDQLSMVAREIENTVIITDQEGEILWINESYRRKYGLDLEAFKEKFGSNIFDDPPSEEVERKFIEVIKEKKTVQFYLSNEDVDGNMVHVKTTLSPRLNTEGILENYILIDTEITDLIRAEQELTKNRDELQLVYSQVSESIDYAQRIQEAVLPHEEKIKKYFSDFYLFYRPKDVVSGDFYFVEETEEYIYFAGADCTGHGVPGALMSVICYNLLENAVHRKQHTDEVLTEVHSQLIKKLKQSGNREDQIKDGLDIALCRISKKHLGKEELELQFSGAHSPVYIVHNGNLTEVKGDRVQIGGTHGKGTVFTRHELTIQKGSEIVMFSDGFVDQKGFLSGKKFYYPPFRELIKQISKLAPSDKLPYLKNTFENWQGDLHQGDDVFIWGLKI